MFRQLADLLRNRIRTGDLAPGAALPSELQLAQTHGLSRTSVRQAIALLRAEGLVQVERPKGTYVRGGEPIETVALRKGTSISTRMPTPAERRELDIPEGVPIFVVAHPDGTEELYRGDRTRLTC